MQNIVIQLIGFDVVINFQHFMTCMFYFWHFRSPVILHNNIFWQLQEVTKRNYLLSIFSFILVNLFSGMFLCYVWSSSITYWFSCLNSVSDALFWNVHFDVLNFCVLSLVCKFLRVRWVLSLVVFLEFGIFFRAASLPVYSRFPVSTRLRGSFFQII